MHLKSCHPQLSTPSWHFPNPVGQDLSPSSVQLLLAFVCLLSPGGPGFQVPRRVFIEPLPLIRPQTFPTAHYTSRLVTPGPFPACGVLLLMVLLSSTTASDVETCAPASCPATTSLLACPNTTSQCGAHRLDGQGPGPPAVLPPVGDSTAAARLWLHREPGPGEFTRDSAAMAPHRGLNGRRWRDELWDWSWKRREAHTETDRPGVLRAPPPTGRMWPCGSGRTPGVAARPVPGCQPCCQQSEWQSLFREKSIAGDRKRENFF